MVTAETQVFGRGEELAAIAELLSVADLPRAIVLEGEAGIGKTTLWLQAVDAAQGSYRVLSSRPAEPEAQMSFAGIVDLFDETIDEALAGLPPPQRHSLEVAVLLADPVDALPDPAGVSFAFLGALRALALSTPLLLAIDDVQWLDPQSRLLIEFACRRLRDEPIALLVTFRREADQSIPLELEPGLETDRVQHLQLGPLSVGALQQLFRTRLGLVFPRPALRRIHEVSGGNPFFALEFARALQAEGEREPGMPLPLPRSLEDLVAERLQALPERTRAGLEIAALLAEPTIDVVEAAVDFDISNALEPAVDAGIVEVREERIRFAHPLLASAMAASIDSPRLRELHRRLSELVPVPEARARHLALGSEEPKMEVAATLEQAAYQVRGRGAAAAAAELLEQSLRLTPEEDIEGWARRALAAAELHEPAGDTARSQALATAVVDRVATGPLRAEALIVRSYWNSSAEVADEAVAHAAGHSGILARALYNRARASFNRGDVRAGIADARAAVELAVELDDLILLAHARAELGRIELVLGLPSAHATLERARADRLRAGVIGSIYFSAETWLGCERLWRDDVDGARALFEERRALAVEDDDADALGGVLMRLVEVEWRAGNWRTAAAYAQKNVELAEQRGNFQKAAVLYAQALVAAHLGELDAAETDAGEALRIAEPTGNNVYSVNSRCVLAFIAASRGDHTGVLEWVGDLADRLRELGYEHPGCCVYAGDELEALVAARKLERAERRIAELEQSGRRLDLARTLVYAHRGRALLAAARGDLDGAARRLEAALAEHERLPVPFERGRSLLVRGQIQRRARRRRAARESLREALAIFEQVEAEVWAETARVELARIGGRAPAGKTLTPTEQRIAELVAEGKTNREVAAELFVTVRTVEGTLTRIYAKLGIRSRTELASRSKPRAGPHSREVSGSK